MNSEIQFAKVTCSGKLPDRFLTCQHLKAEDLAKAPMGEIFSLIEILSPWFPTAQIGKLIINNFAKYYYDGGSTSDLVNFENSLKRINEDLAQVTQEGETDWIGNLNGILVAIVGNNLHLSSCGQTEAYMFRDGKVNHLTYGLSETTQPHPLKTFSNIISGELKNHDKILITNRDLFNHLSLDSVHQMITLNRPSMAGLEITRLLRKERVRNVNLIIINLVEKEELESTALQEKETVFYLDKSTESPLAKIGVFWKNLILPLGKFFAGRIKKVRKPGPKKEPTPQDRFHREFLSDESRDDGLLKDEEIKYSPELYIHYYKEKRAASKKDGRLGIIKNVSNWLMLKIKQLIAFMIATFRDPSRRKYLYIAIALIIMIIIGSSIGLRGRSSKIGNLQAQKILDEAIAAQKNGKSLMASGDNEKAKEQFVLSISKAAGIEKNPLVANDAQNVVLSSYQELDKLTSTTRFSDLKPILSIGEAAKGLFVAGGEVYLVTDSDIYKGTLVGAIASKVASIPKIKGTFVTGTRAGNIIYLYTSDQNLYQFDTTNNKIDLAKIAVGARWETANSITNYVGSLYLLDGVLGQIYKHTSSSSQFNKGEEYILTTNINLKQSVSLAIDDSIYVLKNDGRVLKLQKSKLQDFSLKNIPTPFDKIAQGLKIFTDADTPSVYILDSDQKRILEFDKDGQFIHQYALPSTFNKITDFVVSAKSRKIWILESNNLYEISI